MRDLLDLIFRARRSRRDALWEFKNWFAEDLKKVPEVLDYMFSLVRDGSLTADPGFAVTLFCCAADLLIRGRIHILQWGKASLPVLAIIQANRPTLSEKDKLELQKYLDKLENRKNGDIIRMWRLIPRWTRIEQGFREGEIPASSGYSPFDLWRASKMLSHLHRRLRVPSPIFYSSALVLQYLFAVADMDDHADISAAVVSSVFLSAKLHSEAFPVVRLKVIINALVKNATPSFLTTMKIDSGTLKESDESGEHMLAFRNRIFCLEKIALQEFNFDFQLVLDRPDIQAESLKYFAELLQVGNNIFAAAKSIIENEVCIFSGVTMRYDVNILSFAVLGVAKKDLPSLIEEARKTLPMFNFHLVRHVAEELGSYKKQFRAFDKEFRFENLPVDVNGGEIGAAVVSSTDFSPKVASSPPNSSPNCDAGICISCVESGYEPIVSSASSDKGGQDDSTSVSSYSYAQHARSSSCQEPFTLDASTAASNHRTVPPRDFEGKKRPLQHFDGIRNGNKRQMHNFEREDRRYFNEFRHRDRLYQQHNNNPYFRSELPPSFEPQRCIRGYDDWEMGPRRSFDFAYPPAWEQPSFDVRGYRQMYNRR